MTSLQEDIILITWRVHLWELSHDRKFFLFLIKKRACACSSFIVLVKASLPGKLDVSLSGARFNPISARKEFLVHKKNAEALACNKDGKDYGTVAMKLLDRC